jgi:hypothetical protein
LLFDHFAAPPSRRRLSNQEEEGYASYPTSNSNINITALEESFLSHWSRLAKLQEETGENVAEELDNEQYEEQDKEEEDTDINSSSSSDSSSSHSRRLSSVHRTEHSDVDAAEDFLSKMSSHFSEEKEVNKYLKHVHAHTHLALFVD